MREVTYSGDSIRAADELAGRFGDYLAELAAEHVAAQGRRRVETADLFTVADEAFRQAVEEAQSEWASSEPVGVGNAAAVA